MPLVLSLYKTYKNLYIYIDICIHSLYYIAKNYTSTDTQLL